MEIVTYASSHLVKGEDLNHHGTLYAGRTAEWFVESGFIAAAALTKPEQIVCLKIHGMTFTRSVKKGEVITFRSKIVLTGRTRIVAYIDMISMGTMVVDGFITFINVDQDSNPLPHGIKIEATSPEDIELQEKAKNLSK
jgi:acyl-CoA hydrolase